MVRDLEGGVCSCSVLPPLRVTVPAASPGAQCTGNHAQTDVGRSPPPINPAPRCQCAEFCSPSDKIRWWHHWWASWARMDWVPGELGMLAKRVSSGKLWRAEDRVAHQRRQGRQGRQGEEQKAAGQEQSATLFPGPVLSSRVPSASQSIPVKSSLVRGLPASQLMPKDSSSSPCSLAASSLLC